MMFRQIARKAVSSLLIAEARLVLKKYHPKIVAVTGSVGKTSTKDAVACVLGAAHYVRKSEKSFNTEIGVPLTILGCGNAWSNVFRWIGNLFEGLLLIIFPHHYPEWLVLEVGADRPGDIASLATWLRPDIAVITHIGARPVHVEFFESPEALANEKAFLARAVPEGGHVILPADDPIALNFRTLSRGAVHTYGFDPHAELVASHAAVQYDGTGRPTGMTYKMDYKGKSVPIRITGVVGMQAVSTTLPAILVGILTGQNLIEIAESLLSYAPAPGRGRILDGLKGSILIDDTYNSSPAAAHAALETLLSLEVQEGKGRKIAILGDMMELGKYTIEAHTEVGKHVAEVCDLFLAVGQRAKLFADGAREHGMPEDRIRYFENATDAARSIKNEIGLGDLILVKGSQYMRMERGVEELMARPQDAHLLLVRQEEEWKKR